MSGCPTCGKKQAARNLSKSKQGDKPYAKRILEDGPKIHNHKFDYSLINAERHIGARDLIEIICPRHGKIEVQADVHLNGHDCNKCRHEDFAASRGKDERKFIQQCQKKWGFNDDYYSLVQYRGGVHPIILKCSKHGPFEVSTAKGHLQKGYGCNICSGNQKKTRDEIIKLSSQKHGNLYDYSKVEEVIENVHQKITVICKLHGEFKTKAAGHYNMGYGCPQCGLLKSGVDNLKAFADNESRAQSYCELYLVGIDNYFKIGIAEDSYKRDPAHYEEYITILPSTRANCWVAEQYLLIKTAWMEPTQLPDKFRDWCGRNELRERLIEAEELAEYMQEVLDKAIEMNWKSFASKYELPDHGYGWDPDTEF